MQKTQVTQEEAWLQLQTYCKEKERCQAQAVAQLLDLNITETVIKQIITDLKQQDLLNEDRFACAYVRDKMKSKKWGRQRLIKELTFLKIPVNSIKKAFSEIDNTEYIATLKAILIQKTALYRLKNDAFETRKKAAIYALKKGYEQSLIWVVINELE